MASNGAASLIKDGLLNRFKNRHRQTAYIIALIVIVTLGLLTFLVLLQVTAVQQPLAQAIRYTVNQETAVERIANLIMFLDTSPSPSQVASQVMTLNDEFDIVMSNHTHWMELSLPTALDDRLTTQLSAFIDAARRFTQPEAGFSVSMVSSLQTVLQLSQSLHEQYDQLVETYDLALLDSINLLRAFAVAFISSLIGVLVFVAWFIFRPMEQAIRWQHEQLEAEIRQRHRSEAAVRQSEQTYRLLVQHLPDTAVLIFDHDLRFTLADGPALDRIDYPRMRVEGKSLRDIIPPEAADQLEPYYRRALAGIDSVLEYPFRGRDFSTQFVPLFDEGQTVLGGLITAQDITTRKQAEAALRTREAQFRSITENVTDMIALLDAELRFIYANPAFETTLGYPPSQLVGQPADQYLHPDDADRIRQHRPGSPTPSLGDDTLQFRCRHQHGHYLWVEGRQRYLYTADGQYEGVVVLLRDLTEQQRVQALQLDHHRLQTSLDKEQELSQLKAGMMLRITHEFRTPLAVLWAAFETLYNYSDRLTDDQRLGKRRTMQLQIHQITDMLDDITLVIQGDLQVATLKVTEIDLRANLAALAVVVEAQLGQTHRFALCVPAETVIRVDWLRLKRALQEVMSNAARFSAPETQVQVTVERDVRGVTITVSDQGIGIPAADQAHVFDPFFRGSNINERGGLGLGLTIARGIILAHQGSITLDNPPAGGTRVAIWLPGSTLSLATQ